MDNALPVSQKDFQELKGGTYIGILHKVCKGSISYAYTSGKFSCYSCGGRWSTEFIEKLDEYELNIRFYKPNYDKDNVVYKAIEVEENGVKYTKYVPKSSANPLADASDKEINDYVDNIFDFYINKQ